MDPTQSANQLKTSSQRIKSMTSARGRSQASSEEPPLIHVSVDSPAQNNPNTGNGAPFLIQMQEEQTPAQGQATESHQMKPIFIKLIACTAFIIIILLIVNVFNLGFVIGHESSNSEHENGIGNDEMDTVHPPKQDPDSYSFAPVSAAGGLPQTDSPNSGARASTDTPYFDASSLSPSDQTQKQMTNGPSGAPQKLVTNGPTNVPSDTPQTDGPSGAPQTDGPSVNPTGASASPSSRTGSPTDNPKQMTDGPTESTGSPTDEPSHSTDGPSQSTVDPSGAPLTGNPSGSPLTVSPSGSPLTNNPSDSPSTSSPTLIPPIWGQLYGEARWKRTWTLNVVDGSPNNKLTGIELYGSGRLVKIKCQVNGQWSAVLGEWDYGVAPVQLILQDNEYFNQMELRTQYEQFDQWYGGDVIGYLKLSTNLGRSIETGNNGGTYSQEGGDNKVIVQFGGTETHFDRTGAQYIHTLQFAWRDL